MQKRTGMSIPKSLTSHLIPSFSSHLPVIEGKFIIETRPASRRCVTTTLEYATTYGIGVLIEDRHFIWKIAPGLATSSAYDCRYVHQDHHLIGAPRALIPS